MKYRKKPIEIEAEQLTMRNVEKLRLWCGGYIIVDGKKYEGINIPTLEGDMKANFKDWIIKGINGEFYPVKNDIFEKTYEAIQ